MKAYENSQLWSSREYHRVANGGQIRWMTDMVNLVRDKRTDEIYMFACFSDIQQRYEWEQQLEQDIEHDIENGFYNMKTARLLAEMLIKERKKAVCAMALIQINGSSGGNQEEVKIYLLFNICGIPYGWYNSGGVAFNRLYEQD